MITGLDRARPDRPKLLWPLALLGLSLVAGTVICLYLTRFHEIEVYGDQSATLSNCPQTETTDCEAVNTSAYSELIGVPISALGVPTYLLLLALTGLAWRRPRLLAYVGAIGLLTVFYSAYLYYVASVRIGFLCAWCLRLYGINASIPVLAWISAWRSPAQMLREVLADLLGFVPEVRTATAVFAAFLALTVGGDRIYRAGLSRAHPIAQAPVAMPIQGGSPPEGKRQEAAPAEKPAPPPSPVARQQAAADAFVLPGPLKELRGSRKRVELTASDLQGRIGRGRPVALIFWAPGYALSESALLTLSHFLKGQAPEYEAFAVAGKRDDQRVEILWEAFSMLAVPPGLPLLVDEGFSVSKQLQVTDVPDLVLIDGSGKLVTTKIKALNQGMTLSPEHLTAEQLIRRVAKGAAVSPVTKVPPYFPATQLYGHCAPELTLPEVPDGKDVTFTGRSSNGKPTFLLFWSATCKHCQKEIPQLLAHLRGHHDDYNVVSVALIKPDRADGFSHRRVTEAYIRTNGIPWPVLDDSSDYAAELYRVVSTPTTFLIAPNGEVVDAWYYPHQNLAPAIQEALARLAVPRGQCRPGGPDRIAKLPLSILDPGGRQVSLSSLADRPAVVHFWATWCEPCRTELPSLVKFGGELGTMGGRLILVSVEGAEAADRVRTYGTGLGQEFESFLDPEGGMADRLDIAYSVPRTFLLSRGGNVLKTYYGSQRWDDPAFRGRVRTLLQLADHGRP